jgi:DNA-binding MarR family transcriptional regulator
MSLAPSTITRFVDKLIDKGLIYREVNGKTSQLYTTEAGKDLNDKINQAWGVVYERYCELIGEDRAVELTREIFKVNQILKG